MDEKLLKSFESMLKKGNYAGIEPLLKEFAALNPEDWEAKMLYGTCRLLQGDTETAKRIHDELEPHFSADLDLPEAERTFWQKYHRWIIYGSTAALVIGAVGYAALGVLAKSASVIFAAKPIATKYAGPPVDYYCKKCGKPTSIGWGWIEDEKYRTELKEKVDKGLIPCKNCGKDTPYGDPAFVSPRAPKRLEKEQW